MKAEITRCFGALALSVATLSLGASMPRTTFASDFTDELTRISAACRAPLSSSSFSTVAAAELCRIKETRPVYAVYTPGLLDLFDRYAQDVKRIIYQLKQAIPTIEVATRRCSTIVSSKRDYEICVYQQQRPIWAKVGSTALQRFNHYQKGMLSLAQNADEGQIMAYNVEIYKRQQSLNLFVIGQYFHDAGIVLDTYNEGTRQRTAALALNRMAREQDEIRQAEQELRENDRWLRQAQRELLEIRSRGPEREEDDSCEARALIFGALAGALSRQRATTGMNAATAGLNGCRQNE